MVFTFNSFNDFVRVPIPLMNDSIYELTETFIAGLSFTSDFPPRTTISPDNATITIIDDESMFKKIYSKDSIYHLAIFLLLL